MMCPKDTNRMANSVDPDLSFDCLPTPGCPITLDHKVIFVCVQTKFNFVH